MSTTIQFKYKTCLHAVINNDLNELQCMYDADYEVSSLYDGRDNPLEFAMQKCTPMMMDWLFKHGCKKEINQKISMLNAKYECLLFAWIHELIHPNQYEWLMVKTIVKNDLQFFEAIYNKCGQWPAAITSHIAEFGRIEFMQYAHKHGCSWDINTTAEAAKNNHLDCLRYAHESGCQWHPDTTYWASFTGSLKCLQYAHQNNCRLAHDVLYVAAAEGHIDCLDYGYKHGCTWDNECTFVAATYDKVDVLRYAYTRNCDWHPDTIIEAVANHSIKCFTYCFEVCENKQEFWCLDYDCMTNKISLDDPVWRKLFSLDLRACPKLHKRVEAKKVRLFLMVKLTQLLLQNYISNDVIQFCVNPFY